MPRSPSLAEVLCDTSFAMHAAPAHIRNEGLLDTEIGELRYIVPPIVVAELGSLRREGERHGRPRPRRCSS